MSEAESVRIPLHFFSERNKRLLFNGYFCNFALIMEMSQTLNNILQTIGVAVIVIMAVVWLIRRIIRKRKGDAGCGCSDCEGCDMACPSKPRPKDNGKSVLPFVAVLCLGAQFAAASHNEEALRKLDALIEHMADYTQVREAQFEDLRRQEAGTKNLEEKFWLKRTLFDHYTVFDCDSAALYGDRAINMARLLDRPDLEAELHIKKSYTLTAIGLLDQGLAELEMVDKSCLSADAMVDYLGQRVYWLTHSDQYRNITSQDEPYSAAVAAVLDSINDIIEPSHPEYVYYLSYRAMRRGADEQRAALAKVEPLMANFKYDKHEEAKAAWTVSQLHKFLGDTRRYEEMLINSAFADLRVVNRDIASLEDLADIRYQDGDLERAYKYIGYCIECAAGYKNRARVLGVATKQTDINKAYQDRVTYLQGQTRTYLSVLVVMIIFLLGTTLYIYFQRRRLSASNVELHRANERVQGNLQGLSDAYQQIASNNEQLLTLTERLRLRNEELALSETSKRENFGSLFMLCSKYLDKISQVRRNIGRQLKAKQYDAALSTVENAETGQDEVKDFHEQFDRLFLKLYPTFVSDFNSLLRPGEEIIPKEEGRLNTDLRIYALIFLGITDSVTIAEVLHCASQTVYNKRMKVRNKAIDDKDRFVDRVRALSPESDRGAGKVEPVE